MNDINIAIKITKQDIDTILCDAFEGGIAYWASDTYPCDEDFNKADYLGEWSHEQIGRGGMVCIVDAEDGSKYLLTKDKLLVGIKTAIQNGDLENAVIKNGKINIEEMDASDADVIVQYALFGELVFG